MVPIVIGAADLGITVRPDGPPEQRVPCPQCGKGGRDDALGVNIETGVFHCFRCGWRGRVGDETRAPTVRQIDDPELAERKRKRLKRTWSESVALGHPAAEPVRRYLTARGLGCVLDRPPASLRAHPGLAYYDGAEHLGTFPAMLAMFTDTNGARVTLHATYLRHDGTTKAAVRVPKKLLPVPIRGSTRGGAIRLYPPHRGVLGVAEGIETALSLSIIQRVPVCAAYCADALERMRLPRSVRTLYIAADADERGKRAARGLAERVRRWKPNARVLIVTSDAGDLNDELRRMQA
jgi:hypothetical protein